MAFRDRHILFSDFSHNIPNLLKGIVMVNFMCQLEWATGAQIKHSFWVCLRGCFQVGLAFESMDSVNCPPQWGWASSNLLRDWIKQKVEEGRIHHSPPPITDWAGTSHLLQPSDWNLHHLLPWFSGLWTWTELYQQLSWASSLQTSDRETSHSP